MAADLANLSLSSSQRTDVSHLHHADAELIKESISTEQGSQLIDEVTALACCVEQNSVGEKSALSDLQVPVVLVVESVRSDGIEIGDVGRVGTVWAFGFQLLCIGGVEKRIRGRVQAWI